jgi:hypothetical protein
MMIKMVREGLGISISYLLHAVVYKDFETILPARNNLHCFYPNSEWWIESRIRV